MTDKKDFTSITDLGEFEHTDDPDIDAKLAEELKSKTTITKLEDLDGDLNSFDSNDQSDTEIEEEQSFDEFQYGESDETDSEDFSPTDPTGEIETDDMNFDSSDSDFGNDEFSGNNFEDDSGFEMSESDDTSEDSSDESESFENYDNDFNEENSFDDNQNEESEDEFSENSDNDSFSDNDSLEDEDLSEAMFTDSENDDESDNNENDLDEPTQESIVNDQYNDEEEDNFRDANTNDVIEEMSVDQDLADRAPTPQYTNDPTPPSPQNFTSTSSHSETIGMASIQSEEVQEMAMNQMQSLAENMTDNVPEIPRISTTFQDFKQEVENLTYAPSPDGSGPLFGIKLTGNLASYQDHMQSIFDEFQIDVNLKENAYQGPLNAGLMQITRINEYIAIQLGLSLAKYGIKVKVFYLEDLIAEDGLEPLETKGLESEYNLPQNKEDQAEFVTNDWDEDEILMTTTSGPSGYKVLKRCGLAQKIMTIDAEDFEKLQVDMTAFFNDDLHLSGSSTLLDGVIKKIHEELKEQARDQGANAIVNFKLEQRLNPRIVSLHFTGDLLYIRKLKI